MLLPNSLDEIVLPQTDTKRMSDHQQQGNAALKSKAVRGGVVTLSAQMAMIAIQMASVIILSRLLPPEDFGIIAMIMALIAFMTLFRDMGLSTASIQKVTLSNEQVSTLFWVNVAAGLVLTALVLALSPLVAWFYSRPELQAVCAALSASFLITSVGAQHGAMMQRELRFLPKAIADVSGALVNLLIACTLAFKGFGYWSLAVGTIAGTLTTTTLYLALGRFRVGRPRRGQGIREMLGFGADVTGFEIANYFSRNLDNILLGRIWGPSALGAYSRAYQLMMLPIYSLRTPINAVAFPVLSRLRSDPVAFRHYYCRVSTLLAFLSMPLMAFLCVNSRNVISVSIGDKWLSVVPIFVLLGITGFIQPVAGLRGMVLLSLGHSRRYLIWGVLNAAAVCLSFVIGVNWGPEGIALAYALVNYAILYPSLVFSFKDSPLSTSDFFRSISLPLLGSAIASATNFLLLRTITLSSPIETIAINCVVFTTAYMACIAIVPKGRETLKFYARLIRNH